MLEIFFGLLKSEVLQLLRVLRKSETFISLNAVSHFLFSLCTPFRLTLELSLVFSFFFNGCGILVPSTRDLTHALCIGSLES